MVKSTMSENLLEENTPKTQSVGAGKALAQFLGLDELPEVIALANGSRMVLSSKKDCYYTVTSQGCSCRAGSMGSPADIGSRWRSHRGIQRWFWQSRKRLEEIVSISQALGHSWRLYDL